MTALSNVRKTLQMGEGVLPKLLSIPVKASTKCYQGGIAVLDAGYAAPGRTAASLIAAGVFEQIADNTSGGTGAINAQVRSGVFKFLNSTSGDLIAQANVGADCYIVDDQTVALTSNSSARSRAGKVIQVDSDGGVWVQLGIGL
jgi:hypothetical protein